MPESFVPKRPESIAFERLKAELNSFPRLAGYYVIDLLSIEDCRAEGLSEEAILDVLFQFWDDEQWPPPSERPQDQLWSRDYVVSADVAREHVITSLVGGRGIGHVHDTMSRSTAESLWRDFEALFSKDTRRYYTGMGLGDQQFVYQVGAVIVDRDRAGIMWIVESD